MTNLLLASLVSVSTLACATSDADIAAAPAAPTPRAIGCTVGGDVLVRIDQHSDTPSTAPTSKLVLYRSGAWTFVEHLDGKLVKQSTGCVSTEITDLQRTLAAASWKA